MTKELYKNVLLDHNRQPRNWGKVDGATETEGTTALCGDNITIYTLIDNDKITDISFISSSCAICRASGSIMMTLLKGKTLSEATELIDATINFFKGNGEVTGDLMAFEMLHKFPTRIKCATLAWDTALEAIQKNELD